jgi:cytochrome c5
MKVLRGLFLATLVIAGMDCQRSGDASNPGSAGGGQSGATAGAGGSDAGSGGHDGSSMKDAAVADGATDAADAQAPAPAFAAVLAVFKTRCVSCHAAGAIVAGLPRLHLTADVAYRSLVGVPAEQTCGGILVVPSDSARSYLVDKLVNTTPCEGVRMPMAAELGTFMPLSDADVAAVRSWIDQGALP